LPGVAETAAHVWTERYPGLTIVGTSAANPDDPDIVADIKRTEVDILLVAYGAPKQDLFIAKHKNQLKVPVMIGVGGTFDTLIGTKYNPPRWMKIVGLEWLAYLIRYPSRFKRIWRATVGFFLLCINNPH
jgi:N-acetylglucosaminyldiphosphoundecaprenol N-acetyl-beta-D-mannosaminyltransferase